MLRTLLMGVSWMCVLTIWVCMSVRFVLIVSLVVLSGGVSLLVV